MEYKRKKTIKPKKRTAKHWIKRIEIEYQNAIQKFGKFNTPHEGYTIILDELDELWNIIENNQNYREMQNATIRVAVMVLRFLVDCCYSTNKELK